MTPQAELASRGGGEAMGEAEREPETPAQPSAVSCCGALLLADLAGLKIWFAETLYDAFCHLKSDCTPCAVIAIDSSTAPRPIASS